MKHEKTDSHADFSVLPLDSHVFALDSPACPVLVDNDRFGIDSVRIVHMVQS